MNTATLPEREKELARQAVDRFVRRFEESYRLLAYHAALPLVLTPELLNYLRNQFLRGQVPWVAEVDLLLSELCAPVGYELYAMDTAVRAYLLEEMQQQEALGEPRMQAVARLLLRYVRQANANPFIGKQALEAQQWAAMVYLDDRRERAVRQIAEAFQERIATGGESRRAELARLSRITQELAPQLSAYPNFIKYAELVGRLLARSAEVEAEALNRSYPVLEVELHPPEGLVAGSDGSPLQGFEFEVVRVDRRGREIERRRERGRYFSEDLGEGVALEMVEIPGGTFLMGSPAGEGRDSERPQHEVTVSSFFMGKYPVTQAQWRAVANLPKVNRDLKPNPSKFKGDNRPVERVSWYDAVEFTHRLSRQTGRHYRLPSEAEWEYACRAGTTTPFHFGETLTDKLANYNASETFAEEPKGEYREQTTPVGSFPPNGFGLYDMHGNVREMCADPWHDNYEGAPPDGSVWEDDNDNQKLVLRGGSWNDDSDDCRCADRDDLIWERDFDNYDIGFRVGCVAGRT